MGPEATEEDIQRVSDKLKEWSYDSHISRGVEHTLIGAVGAPEGEKERIKRFSVLVRELVSLVRDTSFLTEPVESKVWSLTHYHP